MTDTESDERRAMQARAMELARELLTVRAAQKPGPAPAFAEAVARAFNESWALLPYLIAAQASLAYGALSTAVGWRVAAEGGDFDSTSPAEWDELQAEVLHRLLITLEEHGWTL